jgi:hypothetical protein
MVGIGILSSNDGFVDDKVMASSVKALKTHDHRAICQLSIILVFLLVEEFCGP